MRANILNLENKGVLAHNELNNLLGKQHMLVVVKMTLTLDRLIVISS